MFEQIYSQNLQICLCGHICRKYALKINRVQKQQNLKGCFVMDEKKIYTQESAEGYQQKHEKQVASKNVQEKQQSVSNNCGILPLKKIF